MGTGTKISFAEPGTKPKWGVSFQLAPYIVPIPVREITANQILNQSGWFVLYGTIMIHPSPDLLPRKSTPSGTIKLRVGGISQITGAEQHTYVFSVPLRFERQILIYRCRRGKIRGV